MPHTDYSKWKWYLDDRRYRAWRADHVVAYISNLTFTELRWYGKPFRLLPWQEHGVIRPMFGILNPDGTRVFRQIYIEIPKKNGKTGLGAAIGLYALHADGILEEGGEMRFEMAARVYCAASDREQASEVFEPMKNMVAIEPELEAALQVYESTKRIVHRASGSFIRVVSSEGRRQHGKNAHAILFDELHAQPDRRLWDIMTEGSGAARLQPFVFVMTTAGEPTQDENNIWLEVHNHAKRILKDPSVDPQFLPVMYGASKEDDFRDPAVWRAANPAMGDPKKGYILRESDFAADLARAERSPAKLRRFLRLRLNIPMEVVDKWIELSDWDRCAGEMSFAELEKHLKGRVCVAGADLSSKHDLTCLAFFFPPTDDDPISYILVYPFVPGQELEKRIERSGMSYDVWEEAGFIHVSGSNIIDYDAVRERLRWAIENYQVQDLGTDNYGAADAIAKEFEDEFDLEFYRISQGFAHLSEPTKHVYDLVADWRLVHAGHPVLRAAVDNLMVKINDDEAVRPVKKRSKGRIDPFVALVFAIARALFADEEESEWSVYETQRPIVGEL